VCLALGHAYGCGVVCLDNALLAKVRRKVMSDLSISPDSPLLKTSSLVERLLNISRGISTTTAPTPGKLLSSVLSADASTHNDLPSKESLSAQLDFEADPANQPEPLGPDPIPLVIYIPTPHSSSAVLRSKSAVELLSADVNDPASTNLIALGHKTDPLALLKNKEERLKKEQQAASPAEADPNQPDPNAFSMFGGNGSPPPPGSPAPPSQFSFGAAPPQQPQPTSPSHPHAPPNISGANDPAGSRRFNIFLTRKFAGPQGIVGAVAPPAVGNLFQQASNKNMMTNIAGMPNSLSNVKPSEEALRQFNSTSQAQMFYHNMARMNPGSNMQSVKMSGEQLQESIKSWMRDLLEQSLEDDDEDDDPQSSSRTIPQMFSALLKDPKMRGGIAQTLAKAAPALLDPRCMGVQLSIYVPPPMGHKNAGQMPAQGAGGAAAPGWFKKIPQAGEERAGEEGAGEDEGDDMEDVGAIVEGDQVGASGGERASEAAGRAKQRSRGASEAAGRALHKRSGREERAIARINTSQAERDGGASARITSSLALAIAE
jgi:hypothetical protein